MATSKKVSWNLTHLYESDNDPRMENEITEIRAAHTAFEKKWRENKKYLSDSAILLEALDEYESLVDTYSSIGKVGYYWILRDVQDQRAAKTKEMKTRVLALESEIENQLEFFALSLTKVSLKQQKEFLANTQLRKYRHFLEQLFVSSKYMLSEAEEKILTLMSQPAVAKWKALRSEFLAKESCLVRTETGKVERKGFEELFGLIISNNQKVRDSAGKQIDRILRKHAPLAEHELNAILMTNKINNDLRQTIRADELMHVDNDIDSSVVDTLIDTVSGHFDLSQRYYRLKAKLFGRKHLDYYERTAEYGEIAIKYTYDDAVHEVSTVLHDLDVQFGDIFDEFVQDGLIDPFPQAGKHGGAACYHMSRKMPTYQFMNFSGKLNDLRTLAHESGHAINNVLSRVQHGLDCGTSLATAEVASTFMEGFVLDKISQSLGTKERLSLLMAMLDDQASSVFRQCALYNFETELHTMFKEKLYLSQAVIGELFVKHMKSYMGNAIKFTADSQNWWVYWSHIRRPFYVFSYVSGELIAQSLQQSVKADKTFIEKVREFLSAGTSKSPKDIFADLGIDITKRGFWEQGLCMFEQLLKEAENLAA